MDELNEIERTLDYIIETAKKREKEAAHISDHCEANNIYQFRLGVNQAKIEIERLKHSNTVFTAISKVN